jgi:predicted ATPase
MLQQGLRRLVEAELLYQRGLLPQAHYLFKHALIQDTAYQSLLKSTRQQYHQQIARILEERFPDTKETQPELLARHYTEAGLIAQAIPFWQRAGQRASQRSANTEAIAHLTKGLELLGTLPDTPERIQQELTLQITLGGPLIATKGYGAPEVERTCTRALELCRQLGETPQLFPVLHGLVSVRLVQAEDKTAHELAEQCLSLAQSMHGPTRLMWAHNILGQTLFYVGEFALAQDHMEQAIALYDPQKDNPLVSGVGQDPKVTCLCFAARVLWLLGYPNQALKRIHEALTLAQELSHPFTLAYALHPAARLHQFRREGQATQEQAEALMALSSEQRFPFWLALGTILRGWALAEQGQGEEGVAQIRQGLFVYRATGAEYMRTHFLALLAEAYEKVEQAEEGLSALSEALMLVNKTGERSYEAELCRIKGELTLQQFNVQRSRFKVEESSESEVKTSLGQVQDKSQTSLEQVRTSQDQSEVSNTQHPAPSTQAEVEREAEEYFLKAIEIARRQQAKSLELRATMSLVRLRQQQATQYASRTTQHEARTMLDAARNMLSEIYGWFTEGFDTKDLQEAKALLQELA